ncbi:hypothetical protein [Nocardioides sp. CFH 31398]|uniref:hypothetical protein n=1 Tax=Nocardioides sp. CFH 31398 TaxID=2919579 RepID=UPI001F05E71C|nr:hypothetical protein [Nocardioides sp. CFH 31398]MCH1867463.1 hypothetical protein [Nocardioides sp. CFH 31398]
MTWLALLLLGVAVVDLVRGRWSQPVVPEIVGALTVLVAGALVGAGPTDVGVLLLAGAVVVGWSLLVRLATTPAGTPLAALLALSTLGGGVVLALLASPLAPAAGGPFATWARELPWSVAAADPDRLLLVVALVGVQLATGNLAVRLVLAATRTAAPEIIDSASRPSQALKGGRLLGPMERLLILGLGLAGQVTAASIVIAAKGLLRWPELQSPTEQAQVHQLTEYFLVGSFVSWSLALGSLALVAGAVG